MFGMNKPRSFDTDNRGFLQVAEIFPTLQGEGPFSGRRAVFVRLTGCNLRCWFCDTSWDDDNDPTMRVDDIATTVFSFAKSNDDVVVITGGEPLRQDIAPLVEILTTQGHTVQIETAGTFVRACIAWDGVHVVVSPKIAYVAQPFKNRRNVTWKYVLSADAVAADGLPAGSIQRLPDGTLGGGDVARPPAHVKPSQVYIQPCDEKDPEKYARNVAAVRDSALRFGYIASVQLHKLLGVE